MSEKIRDRNGNLVTRDELTVGCFLRFYGNISSYDVELWEVKGKDIPIISSPGAHTRLWLHPFRWLSDYLRERRAKKIPHNVLERRMEKETPLKYVYGTYDDNPLTEQEIKSEENKDST